LILLIFILGFPLSFLSFLVAGTSCSSTSSSAKGDATSSTTTTALLVLGFFFGLPSEDLGLSPPDSYNNN